MIPTPLLWLSNSAEPKHGPPETESSTVQSNSREESEIPATSSSAGTTTIMAKEKPAEEREQPDDSWELPLPEELQILVNEAPKTRAELDDYFKSIMKRTWADPAARAHAMAVYLDELDSMSTTHLTENELRDLGFFAAEMRVLREKCRI